MTWIAVKHLAGLLTDAHFAGTCLEAERCDCASYRATSQGLNRELDLKKKLSREIE